MKNKLFYWTLTLSILILLINVIAMPFLPDKVPVHWNFNGEVDRYGSKTEQLFLGALPLILFLFLQYLPRLDPKKASFQRHSKAYSIINFLVIIFLAAMNMIVLGSALGFNVKISLLVPPLLGILFIGIGNYMSQIRPNYFIGFRTPWTLSSEYVWKKTHRFGGFVFILIGVISIAMTFFGGKLIFYFLPFMALGLFAIYVYSFLVYRKQP